MDLSNPPFLPGRNKALDLLKVWGTGHPGGIATLHAGSALGALLRLEQLILEVAITPPRALIADSTAAMAGSLLGTSTTTSYIESAAGVSAGGRTGLTAVVVAVLFLLALFFAPLAGSVPAFATAPALLFVAVLMASGLAEIDWDDITVAAPVVITALAMPFTYSIANGIAFGFISWTAIKVLSGRWRELNSALVILSILFVIKLGWFNA
ncbi:hypothetical protein CVE36_01390 [Pseudomonas syringae pv. actinidiae]|nr:hypothetical protein [Pseudomonas syringae pv. actinidiae]